MQTEIEYLIATTDRTDMTFLREMNVRVKAIVTNQCDRYNTEHSENCVMISTPTRGVGINRNLGLSLAQSEYSLIVDDDMVFYDDAEEIIHRALQALPDADVIIFNFDYIKSDGTVKPRMKSAGKIKRFNCLNYGICCALVKNSTIRKNNISFSTLFGGGCKYSCGEDSLFYWDCVKNGMRIYTYIEPIGKNEYRESTWFKGYNEKFFYDKGAWIACAFGRYRHWLKWYFIFRLRSFTDLPTKTVIHQVNAGIKGFADLKAYAEERAQ